MYLNYTTLFVNYVLFFNISEVVKKNLDLVLILFCIAVLL